MEIARLVDLLGAPFFYYGKFSMNQADGGTPALISDVFDVVQPFEGWIAKIRNIQAIRLLCDEFTVSVHANRLRSALTTPAVYSAAQLNLEAVTDLTTNAGLTFAITNAPDDLTLTLTQTNGVNSTFVPGPRAFRFRLPVTITTAPVPADPLIMEVTGRLRNHAALLMALDRILRGKGQFPGILTETLKSGAIVRRFDTRELCGV